jgi:hypothetical protein
VNGLSNCVVGNSDPLKKGEGSSTVIHPEDDDRHGSYLIPSDLLRYLCAWDFNRLLN